MRRSLLIRTLANFSSYFYTSAGPLRSGILFCLRVTGIVAASDFVLWLACDAFLDAFPRRSDEAFQAHPRRVYRRLSCENDDIVKEAAEGATNEWAKHWHLAYGQLLSEV